MKKAVYIHGLGGSGTGGSSSNIKKILNKNWELSAGTYDLLQPSQAFEQIQKDVKGAELIIASSLGGFMASALPLPDDCHVVLLNPCLKPIEAIEPILWDSQKALFNKEKCVSEWTQILSTWEPENKLSHKKYAGIFADEDEFFHYKNFFDENFGIESGANSFMIKGTHEIAKDCRQLEDALKAAESIFGDIKIL